MFGLITESYLFVLIFAKHAYLVQVSLLTKYLVLSSIQNNLLSIFCDCSISSLSPPIV